MAAEAEERILVPDNFPVHWPDPTFESKYWTWDQMHHPRPKTPLSATFEGTAMPEGATRGMQAIGMPVDFRVIIINGYWFGATDFQEETKEFPPPWWPRVEEEFIRRLPTLRKSWEEEFLPEVQAANKRLRDFEYAGASLDDLFAFIDETHSLRARMWDIHMQVVMPVMGAASRFAEVYEQMLGKPTGNEPFLMLQGYENRSVDTGVALWRLSRSVLAKPDVARLIAEVPNERLEEELGRSTEGRAIWEEFQGYLEEFGWRSDAFELADPAWTEDPSIPLNTLRDYLQTPDDADPARQQEAARKERERLVQDAFERLDGHEGRPIFEMMLGVAQQYLPIQENHNFYIDQMNTVLLRLPFLELGRRLAGAGTIPERDDIFYLQAGELADAAKNPRAKEWPSLVAERKAERERWSAVVPPRELGTRPPESVRKNPISASFWGERPEQSQDAKVIKGTGASAGTVTATARVVRSLAEADKLQPGDVLVCEMTMPAWTPLFATVSAVVADSGGVLSHCAIVAREYGIPCVVGTEIGTQTIKDGQRLTVDGAQGIVRIED